MEFSAAEQNLTTVPPSIGSTKDSGCFHLPDPKFDEFYHRRTANLVTAAMNAILSPFAVAGNFLIVFIICKTSSLHSPSNLLLACLAISDIFVGLVVQPSYVAYRLLENQHGFVPCSVRMLYSTGFYVCYGVSFMTLCTIGCERLLALLYHLRYLQIVSQDRVMKVVSLLWFVNISLTFLQWAYNYTFRTIHLGLWVASLLIAVATQCRIIPIIRHHQRQIRNLNQTHWRGRQMQIKLAINIASISAVYFVLNLPVLVITISHQVASKSKQITSYNLYSWAETVAFINSSVNPLVCLWRVKSIRNEITGLRIWKRLQLARHRFKKDKTPGVIPLDKNLVLVRFRQITAP